MTEYEKFIANKTKTRGGIGFKPESIHESSFDFQKKIIDWACNRGKAAIFADCGLGKTLMQINWASNIKGDVLILAPLAVKEQTVREGEKFGYIITPCEDDKDVRLGINITNYERLEKFDCTRFSGVVLDESSILKNYTGRIRNFIIDSFRKTPYKLACTATPAPNDFMELGNHAEFLDVCSRTEMLAEYFVHDGGETQKWRLKKHATKPFWNWLNSWSVTITKPSDLGFNDSGFSLPELRVHQVLVKADYQEQGYLFPMIASTLAERQKARKLTTNTRAEKVAELVSKGGCWIVWCNLNNEADAITRLIPDAVEIRGSDKPEKKKAAMLGFSNGDIRVLVTKPSIAGFGMNWQHCNQVVFCGLSDSYEEYYQAVRRCWRFGQKKPVDVHIVIADTEGAVLKNIERKDNQATTMQQQTNQEMEEYGSF